jgi:hypothetical protein
MFRIRKEQMDHFRHKGRRAYVQRLVDFVRDEHPDLLFSTPDPVTRVGALVDKAVLHGFSIELETTQLVLLLLLFGDDADKKLDWFREVLADRNYIPIGKARRLVELARERADSAMAARVDRIDVTQPELVL